MSESTITEEEPKTQTPTKYNLEDLIAQMPDGYKPQEEEWGSPVGKEIW